MMKKGFYVGCCSFYDQSKISYFQTFTAFVRMETCGTICPHLKASGWFNGESLALRGDVAQGVCTPALTA